MLRGMEIIKAKLIMINISFFLLSIYFSFIQNSLLVSENFFNRFSAFLKLKL